MGKRIFIVDDDPVIRMLVEEYLTSFGHSVESLDSGNAFLNQIGEEVPDLVVLDLQMPEMTGIDVLKEIRERPEIADLPVIMLSANSDTASVMATNCIEANEYIQKPFELKVVLDAIENQGKKGSD